MHIQFSPVRSDAALSISRSGDILTVNGQALDLSAIDSGDTLPRAAVDCEALASDITRIDSVIHLTLTLPHGEDAPEDVRFPQPITLADGVAVAPGLTEWGGDVTPAAIDWSQRVTAADAAAAALAAWRAGRTIPKLDLCLALHAAGVLDDTDVVTAATGGIPAAFAPIIAAMPPAAQVETRVRWAALVDAPRLHPLIVSIGAAGRLSDAQLDAVFGWPA